MAKKLLIRDRYERLPVEIKQAPLIVWKDEEGKKVPELLVTDLYHVILDPDCS